MATLRAKVQRIPGGTFYLHEDVQDEETPPIAAVTGIANMSAALDLLKTRIAAMPGTIYRLDITVTTR
jgi:hypothetical protein